MYENVHCINCRWNEIMKLVHNTDINDTPCPRCGLPKLFVGEQIIQARQLEHYFISKKFHLAPKQLLI